MWCICVLCVRVPAGNTASALLLVGAGDMASQAVGSGMLYFPLIGPQCEKVKYSRCN